MKYIRSYTLESVKRNELPTKGDTITATIEGETYTYDVTGVDSKKLEIDMYEATVSVELIHPKGVPADSPLR